MEKQKSDREIEEKKAELARLNTELAKIKNFQFSFLKL